MKIKLYIEKNADAIPSGILSDEKMVWRMGERVLASGNGSTVTLGEGVRLVDGGIGFTGDGRMVSTKGTTALIIEGVDDAKARELKKQHPEFVILPKSETQA